MYRGVFTVGVAVTQVMYDADDSISSSALISANALTDYSYINARDDDPIYSARLARCLTGLGPTSTSDSANGDLGGFYINSNMIPNSGESTSCGSDDVILIRPGPTAAGVINIDQCGVFTTDYEGIYTCAVMNSSMMDQSVRFGIYLNGRSESLDLYSTSLNHLSSLYMHSCSSNRSYITKYYDS